MVEVVKRKNAQILKKRTKIRKKNYFENLDLYILSINFIYNK